MKMKMKNNKMALLLVAAIVFGTAAGCSAQSGAGPGAPAGEQKPQVEKITMNIGTLKGPTGMGMVKLMEDAEGGKTANQYHFDILGAPEDMVGKVTTGEVDIVAVPANLAAVLYQKTSNIQMAAVNTLGVLYIVDQSGTVNSVADLKGKTIYASGKGSTPEFVLNYILNSNGIDPAKDVSIEYKSEHTEIATLLLTKKAEIALLPEPFVTTVISKDDTIKRKIDLTQEWEKSANNASQLTMGCMIVNTAFAKEHKEAVDAFLEEYAASVSFVNEQQQKAGELIVKFGIMDNAPLAQKSIPSSNIVYIDGSEMQTSMQKFFEVLFKAEPKAIGGKIPDEGFYYKK